MDLRQLVNEKPWFLLMPAAALSGVLFSCGFAPLGLSWVALGAMAFYLLLQSAVEKKRHAVLAGFVFGLGWFVPGLFWTTRSMVEHGHLSWILALSGLLLLGAVLAFFPALEALLARYLTGSSEPLRRVAALVALMVLGERFRAGAPFDFGWLSPGYAFMDTVFTGWAPLGGIYAVTLCAVLSAGCIAALFLMPRWRYLPLPMLVAAVVILAGGWSQRLSWSLPSGTVDVRVVQANLPVVDAYTQADPAQRVGELKSYADRPWSNKVRDRLLLTPEGVINVPVERMNAATAKALFGLQKSSEALVLFNGFRQEGPHFYNTAFVIDEDRLVYRLDKRELVPFGEFVPAGARWFVDLLGIPLADITPGMPYQPLLKVGTSTAGLMICYENLYGNVLRSFWETGNPDFLIVTANLGWFYDSVMSQHLDFSRMRAMESARPLVSVNNNGMSAVVSSKGTVVRILPAGEAAEMTVGLVGARGEATPYVRTGDWPALLTAFLILLLTLRFSAVSGVKEKISQRL